MCTTVQLTVAAKLQQGVDIGRIVDKISEGVAKEYENT